MYVLSGAKGGVGLGCELHGLALALATAFRHNVSHGPLSRALAQGSWGLASAPLLARAAGLRPSPVGLRARPLRNETTGPGFGWEKTGWAENGGPGPHRVWRRRVTERCASGEDRTIG